MHVGASDRTSSLVFESFVEIFAELQSVPQLLVCLWSNVFRSQSGNLNPVERLRLHQRAAHVGKGDMVISAVSRLACGGFGSLEVGQRDNVGREQS